MDIVRFGGKGVKIDKLDTKQKLEYPGTVFKGNLAWGVETARRRHLDVEDFLLRTARRGLHSWGTSYPASNCPGSFLEILRRGLC